MSGTTRDWDAATYDRVSGPQEEWAREVLARLPLAGDETVLDAGCGSGRVTRLLLERLPRGRVIAVDAAPAMVEKARGALGPDVLVLQADLPELVLDEPVDVVFSNAVFHWIPDHARLFGALHRALRPGGRLVAQCGGEGNVDTFHGLAAVVGNREPYAAHLGDWTGPWNFASPEASEERLRAAGFAEARCWLERRDVLPDEPEAFIATVCLGHHLDMLPEELRAPFVRDVHRACGDPLKLEYVRLNIDARA